MPITINNREFTDQEVLAEYRKRSEEYLEWRQQKAAEFLKNKKREKLFHCEIVEDTSVESEYYLPLTEEIVARVRALKEKIANDPDLKTDEARADEFHDRISEIGYDIEVSGPMPAEYIYTNIDIDDYIYMYRFDIHLFDWKGNADGRTFPASAELNDDEYINLIALLIDQPNCSFQHLAHLSPKFKNIHDKVSDELHNYDFNVFATFCHDHDYAIRMTELRADAQALLEQLKKNNDEYPYKNFLKDFLVNLSVLVSERKGNAPAPAAGASEPQNAEAPQQERLEQLGELIRQFSTEDNFLAADLMEKELKKMINQSKLQMLCPIRIDDDKIQIEFPGIKYKNITFRRGAVAKTLYVFFLRQIERADQDKSVLPCLSQQEMEQYADELADIYRYISGKSKFNLSTLFNKSTVSNDFTNALSSIRHYFNSIFDVDELRKNLGKCYSIEIMGKDRYGNPRYGIDLDVEDFDLGWYSINRRKRQC